MSARSSRRPEWGLAARRRLPALLLMLACPCLVPQESGGHDSLYQVLELRENDDGRSCLSINVHAAELASDFGIDPLRADLDWLAELDSGQRRRLLRRADAFLARTFEFSSGKLRGQLENQLSRSREGNSNPEAGSARPGCLVATLDLPNEADEFLLRYRSSEKRLMVVINRPGRFPEVLDFAPGAEVRIPIRSRP